VNIVVPEVYDPVTDRNIALENARMAFPLYPQMEVVQTGPGRNDWKVMHLRRRREFRGRIHAAIRLPQRGGRSPDGRARFGVGGGTPDFKDGNTWCLDVVGAMKDPAREIPAKNHWTFIDKGAEVPPLLCSTASLIEIDRNGRTVSHKWFMISARMQQGADRTVEVIEFNRLDAEMENGGLDSAALATTKVALLPDGSVLIGQGVNRAANGCNIPLPAVQRDRARSRSGRSLFPADGSGDGIRETACKNDGFSWASRDRDMLPDATVFFAGENREALVRPDDPSFPLTSSFAGVLPRGDPDLGVPVGQIFSPLTCSKRTARRRAARSFAKRRAYRVRGSLRARGFRVRRAHRVGRDPAQRSQHAQPDGGRSLREARVPAKDDDSRKSEVRVFAPNFAARRCPDLHVFRRRQERSAQCWQAGAPDAGDSAARPRPRSR